MTFHIGSISHPERSRTAQRARELALPASPAAKRIISTPVYRKKVPRLTALATDVDHPTEHGGDRQADDAAEHDLPTRRRLGLGTEQEQHGLETFAGNGDERQQGQRLGGGGGIDLGAQFAAERARVAAHPEDHPGEDGTRGQGQEALRCRLGLALQSVGEGMDQQAGKDARGSGQGCADEHGSQAADPSALDQVGSDDGEHQGDLQAFAQGDEETGSHDR